MVEASPGPKPDVLLVREPEQLKALGHPLRLRILEALGGTEGPLTNRDLAQELGVDPGHLHFHVRMLLRAGLIELAGGGHGREKPYRAVARTVRVPAELVSAGLGTDVQTAMLDLLQHGWEAYGGSGTVKTAQVTAKVSPERVLELMAEFVDKIRDNEDPNAEPLVVTAVAHPPPEGSGEGAS